MKVLNLCAILALAFAAPAFACAPPPAHPEILLVGNKGENSVSFIDLDSGREISRRPVSANAPHEIAVSPNGRFAAVVNYGDAVIDVFDIPFLTITSSIDLGENSRPHGLVALKSGGFVATTEGNDSIVILSPNHDFSRFGPGPCPTYDWTVKSISTGEKGTHMIALSPDERIAYTANMQSGTVSLINLGTKDVKTVSAGQEVEGIAVTKDGTEVWASVRGEDKVLVFDADSLERLAEIKVGAFPLRILASPDGTRMVTSNLKDGTVSVLDIKSRKLERTIKVSGTAQTQQVTLLFSDEAPTRYDGNRLHYGTRLYVAETGANKIAEIDFKTGRVIGRLSGGEQGDGLAIVPAFNWKK